MFLNRGRRKTEPLVPHTEDDCKRSVRSMFNTDEIRRDVFNSLRRSGLNRDQAMDAMTEMERWNLIFGKVYGAIEFGELSEQVIRERVTKALTKQTKHPVLIEG